MSTVNFTPMGGAGEVGANSYVVEIGGLRIVLDCGLHPKKEGLAALPNFAPLKEAPDAVIISHAHIDHCGSVPYLMKLFPSTTGYATAPTLRIMDRMLHNSVSVMGILRDERNIPEYPLYEHVDVDNAMRRCYGIDMGQEFRLFPDSPVRVRFHPAGHVLGCASIELYSPDHSLFYTADISAVDQELMPGFEAPANARSFDTLIIESTYGANEGADAIDYGAEADRFGLDIATVLRGGGCVLVPCFALGRAQEILNIVARMQEDGTIPDVPVYASGLGRAIYEIYDRFSGQLKPEARLSPLANFGRVGDVWDPAVARTLLKTPGIIVATSGMMIENTPSAMIAQHMIKETQHGIFFVGYCDPDTLGHRVKASKPGDELVFTLGGQPVKVALENVRSYHFSAHAPRKALQRVVERFNPKNLIFVHGDPPAVAWMHENCGNGCAKFDPVIGEKVVLHPR